MPLLELLEAPPAEPILKLIAEHRNDLRAEKIDLGVGVYRDASGATPIMRAVKSAEHWLVDSQLSKAYLGSRGDITFCDAIENLVFGDAASRGGIYTLQTPGGSGALRVAADIVLRAKPGSTIWISNPTWDNHIPLLAGAGLKVQRYPYYDADRHELCGAWRGVTQYSAVQGICAVRVLWFRGVRRFCAGTCHVRRDPGTTRRGRYSLAFPWHRYCPDDRRHNVTRLHGLLRHGEALTAAYVDGCRHNRRDCAACWRCTELRPAATAGERRRPRGAGQ